MSMRIIEEVQRLLEIERRYQNTQNKMRELAEFIECWDSENPDLLPADHKTKINLVRSFYNFCVDTEPTGGSE